MHALTNLWGSIPPAIRGLLVYVLSTAAINLVFTRYTNEQLTSMIARSHVGAWLVKTCREIGFDPVPRVTWGWGIVRAWVERASSGPPDGPAPGSGSGSGPVAPTKPADGPNVMRAARSPLAHYWDTQRIPAPPSRAFAALQCLAVAMLAISCKGAAAPTAQTDARAAVVIVAEAVQIGECLCVQYANDAAASKDVARMQAAIPLVHKCAQAVLAARASLESAEASIDTWTDVSSKQWVCAAKDGVNAFSQVLTVLDIIGVNKPGVLVKAVTYGNLILSLESTVCNATDAGTGALDSALSTPLAAGADASGDGG